MPSGSKSEWFKCEGKPVKDDHPSPLSTEGEFDSLGFHLQLNTAVGT